jgi:hypothetical protein
VEELHRRVQVAVIGHRHGIHAQFLHARDERLELVAPIEQAVLAVQVQVDELGLDRVTH